jgi:sarcosine oxidase, subunit gamma
MPDVFAIRREVPALAPRPPDGDFTLVVAPPAARFILRGDDSAVGTASLAFGFALPAIPCRAARAGDRSAIWLGPDEWLLIAEVENTAVIGTGLERALVDEPHSLVDVSHRQVAIVLRGRRAARVLSAGCPLDLRSDAFPVDMAARTILAKTEIVLWRQASDCFRIEVWRSFAEYAVALLSEAARGAPKV